jgi:hypothetical protein
MVEPEEWRDVVGFEGYYLVSSRGRVKNIATGKGRAVGRILKPSLNQGYPQVMLCKNSQTTTRKVHILVSAAFLGPCPEGNEVNHIDRCRSNNLADNLEYITHQANIVHGMERHHLATLAPNDVRSIRELSRKGIKPARIIEQFPHIDRKSIYNIRKGRTWKYLP